LIDYSKFSFPEEGIIDLKGMEKGTEVNLHTYRFPVPYGVKKKGRVFYNHGYGDYCGKMAHFMK